MKNRQNELEEFNKNLKEQNAQLAKENKANHKVMDKDATFRYVKSNYIYVRRQLEKLNPNMCEKDVHTMVGQVLYEDEYKQPFFIEPRQFESSMSWWWEHYHERLQLYQGKKE